MTYVYWDLETEPLTPGEIAKFRPTFEAPSNFKDPAKIEARLREQAAEWDEKVALDAKTARILAAGVAIDSDPAITVEGTEAQIIGSLLELFENAVNRGSSIIGFNSERFDWPFLRHRALIGGIHFPRNFLSPWKGRFYWNENLKDTYLLWTMGQSVGTVSNGLDNLARAFGLEGKLGNGANFAELYREDPEAARAYLKQDVELTRALWQRLNI